MNNVTQSVQFYKDNDPVELVRQYGSPLYVYNEDTLRQRCRDMKHFLKYEKFSVSFSAKSNSNLSLLGIVREEGLNVDAVSPGEIYVQLKAGFRPDQIFYISNNASAADFRYAIDNGVTVSVDSLSQLELFGSINRGGSVAIRFNPGIGAGHSDKVVTAGNKTKFGVDPVLIDEVKEILARYGLKLIGINQHIGSLFMEGTPYIGGVRNLLSIASQFEGLEFVDMGGGFGIPYKKQQGEKPLELAALGAAIDTLIQEWTREYGREIEFKIEPGRYISAECGVLLGTVTAVKTNYGHKYVGTDIGFNVLARPMIYDAHHDIEVYPAGDVQARGEAAAASAPEGFRPEPATIVGNICESGDIIARDMVLPCVTEGDILGVLDAGAYGYAMSSTYNSRLRPAEVLIGHDGGTRLIRRRDTFEDLLGNM